MACYFTFYHKFLKFRIGFPILGLGLILQVNLYQTLSSCQGGNSGLSESLQNVRMTALLKSTGLKFYYPEGTLVPLTPTVQCQSEDNASTSTPSALEKLEEATGFKLEEIGYDTGTYILNKTCREKNQLQFKFPKLSRSFCSVDYSQAYKFHSKFCRSINSN